MLVDRLRCSAQEMRLGPILICVRGTHTSIILYSLFFLNFIERLLSFCKQIKAGEKLPFFKYDTPYSAANSFRQLWRSMHRWYWCS